MAFSCRVCGRISPTPNCPAHPVTPRQQARPSKPMRQAIIQRDQGVCQSCGQPVPRGKERIDHKVARIQGGQTTMHNTQLLCIPCNTAKGST